jgi:hypothetical protein
MHKNAMKCNETLRKWYKNKHGASKIMDTLETYQQHKIQNSYFSRSITESKAETEGCQEAATPWHGAGHPLAMSGNGVGPWPIL